MKADIEKSPRRLPVGFPLACAAVLAVLLLLAGNGLARDARSIGRAGRAAGAADKLALVIGNADYRAGRLRNPVNDARAMAKVLGKLGFSVMVGTDLDQRAMEKAIDRFGKRLPKGGVALFYYAGHGVRVNGRNYLIPLGKDIKDAADVKYDAVDAGRVVDRMELAGAWLNIVILDACRDNPFRGLRAAGGGLAAMSGGSGTIIAFATSPGSQAGDGGGQNGVYTGALVKNLATPGLSVEQVFKRTAAQVQRSRPNQVPWFTSSFAGEFYFKPVPAAPPAGQQRASLRVQAKQARPARPPTPSPPAPRQAAPGKSFTNSLGMKFVLIPAGSFMMGSPPGEPKRDKDEGPQHWVRISKSFYMQTREVTQGQWKAVMGSNPSKFKACGTRCPVERVTWNEIQVFIQKLNAKEGVTKYRLPTEAEWEYACRAGTTTPFSTGANITTDQANYDGNYPMPGFPKGEYRRGTVAVGSFAPNAWGLYDMHGNVLEWCRDRYGAKYYASSPSRDPQGSGSGTKRVWRGGGWFSDAGLLRSADRSMIHPGYRNDHLGFRLARTK